MILNKPVNSPLRAGELNDIITIQRKEVIRNEYGANTIRWVDVTHTRAKVIEDWGNRTNENNEIVHNYKTNFIIRLYHNVKDDMRVVWRDQHYLILNVFREVYNQSITLVTELINE